MTTLFLASVTSIEEAQLAAGAGADIIDCKDPGRGALGALPVTLVRDIAQALPGELIVSATIGDLACEPEAVVAAARAMAASGCDIIKVGLFPGGDARGTIAALGACPFPGTHLVGLLLADRTPDLGLIEAMADAGFAGAMLDTAGKARGTLRDHLSDEQLAEFLTRVQARGLFAGLAGSLRVSDIASLMRLKPNVLGFRGALCEGAVRTGPLSADAVRAVRTELDRNGHGRRGAAAE